MLLTAEAELEGHNARRILERVAGEVEVPANDTSPRPMTMAEKVLAKHRVGADGPGYVKPGDPVGYAALFRARHDTRIATLPIGYDDGLPVSASGRGSVLIRGRRMPIAGQVSMNFTTVDVGDWPATDPRKNVPLKSANCSDRM